MHCCSSVINLVKWQSLKEGKISQCMFITDVHEKKLLNLSQISNSTWNVLLNKALLNVQVPNIPSCSLMSFCLIFFSSLFLFIGNRFKEKLS